MARSTTTISHQTYSADRAPWRASASSWRALAIAAVTLMLVMPALVVGVLLIVEAAISSAGPHLANRSRFAPGSAGWRADAPQRLSFRPACRRFEPAPCVTD
jgi:hypothetical protein